MSPEENMYIVRRYFEQLWNGGDMSVADEIIAPDYGTSRAAMKGPEVVKLYIAAHRAAHPHLRFTILSLVSAGDKVIATWVKHCANGSGPQKGPAISGLSVYRLVGGKIAQTWASTDDPGKMRHTSIAPNHDTM
jgi:hypothetical protein